MSYKIVSTVLLVIIASSLLIVLAFKVRTGESADGGGTGQAVARGCCGSAAKGCAQMVQNPCQGGIK